MVEDSDKSVFVVGGESRSWAALEALARRCHASVRCFARREDCLAGLSKRPCDLLIIDCDGDMWDGLEVLAQARQVLPPSSSLVLVNPRDVATAVRAMKLGAADCLEKPVQEEQLRTAIEAGLVGVRPCAALPGQALTPAEGRVLQLILAGKTNAVIGRILHRSRRTVEAHRRNIMHKLGVFTLAGLVMRAMAMGLIIPEQESEAGPPRPAE
jgi:two-component system response regulator FixJ